jgi:hypothetical protein
MSRGSIFTLITQDDISDRYFTAYDLLEDRMNKLRMTGVIPTTKHIETTHILYTKSKYVPYVSIASDYVKVSPKGDHGKLGVSGKTIEFTLPNYGHFTSDIVLHIRFGAIGNKAAYLANATPTAEVPLLRYCAYPGMRLFETVEFRSDGFLIDTYTPEDIIAYKNFFVSPNHKVGWGRCFGQDEINQASYNSKSFTGYINYSNGYQTPKLYHEEFNMFIPLNFWFCEDVSNALINSSTTNSQRTIRINMSSMEKMVQALIYSEVDAVPPNVTQIGTEIVPLPITELSVTSTLYVNNLYTYPLVYDIISSELNFNMIRVHKNQITPLEARKSDILLSSLKYPAEYMCIGFRNKYNVHDFDRWYLMGSDYLDEDSNNINAVNVPAIIWNTEFSIRQLVTREAIQTTTLNSIINSIGVTTNAGIIIYPEISYNFFNDYLPTRYSKNSAVISPYDNNMFLVTFCLYPGKFNPSGHYNLSTDRKMYINYTMNEYGDKIDNPNSGVGYEMVATMSALNFLIRNGDSFQLKYSL